MSAGGFQQTFSQHHTRKGFQVVRHVVVPLVMLLCSALGAFWLYSLFLLITDNAHDTPGAAAAAGKDLVSYTVTTRDEYNNKIPWLRYPADHRFDPLLHTQAFEERYLTPHAEREDDDSVTIPDAKKLIDTKAYPVYFAYADLVRDWAVYDVSAEGWKRSKAHPSKKQGLARFDYRDEQVLFIARCLLPALLLSVSKYTGLFLHSRSLIDTFFTRSNVRWHCGSDARSCPSSSRTCRRSRPPPRASSRSSDSRRISGPSPGWWRRATTTTSCTTGNDHPLHGRKAPIWCCLHVTAATPFICVCLCLRDSVGHKDVEEVQQEWAWTPPQADVPVSFATFLRHAR